MATRGRNGDSLFEDSFYNVDERGASERRNNQPIASSTHVNPAAPVAVQQPITRPTVIHAAQPSSATGRPVILSQASFGSDDGSFYNIDVPMAELGTLQQRQQQQQQPPSQQIANGNQQQHDFSGGWVRNDFNTSMHNIHDTHSSVETHSNPHSALLGSLTPAEIQEIDALCGIPALIQLMEMGFPPEHCRIALKECDGDVSRAITFCLEHGPEEMQWLLRAEANRIAQAASEPVSIVPSQQPEKAKKGGIFKRLFATNKNKQSSNTSTVAASTQQQANTHTSAGHQRPVSTPVTAGHSHSQPVHATGGNHSNATSTAAATTTTTSRPVSTPVTRDSHSATGALSHTHQPTVAAAPHQTRHSPSNNPTVGGAHPPPMNPNFVPSPQPSSHQHHHHNDDNWDDFDHPIPDIMRPPPKPSAATVAQQQQQRQAHSNQKPAAVAAPAPSAASSQHSRPVSMPVQHHTLPQNQASHPSHQSQDYRHRAPLAHDPVRPDPYGIPGYVPPPTAASPPHSTQQQQQQPQQQPRQASPPVIATPPAVATTQQPQPQAGTAASPHFRVAHALLDLPTTSHYGSLMDLGSVLPELQDMSASSTATATTANTLQNAKPSVTIVEPPEESKNAAVASTTTKNAPPPKPPRGNSVRFQSMNYFDGDPFASSFTPSQPEGSNNQHHNSSNFGLDIPTIQTFGLDDSGFTFKSPSNKDKANNASGPDDPVHNKAHLPHNPHTYHAADAIDFSEQQQQKPPATSYYGSVLFTDPFATVDPNSFHHAAVATTIPTTEPAKVEATQSETDSFVPSVEFSATETTAAATTASLNEMFTPSTTTANATDVDVTLDTFSLSNTPETVAEQQDSVTSAAITTDTFNEIPQQEENVPQTNIDLVVAEFTPSVSEVAAVEAPVVSMAVPTMEEELMSAEEAVPVAADVSFDPILISESNNTLNTSHDAAQAESSAVLLPTESEFSAPAVTADVLVEEIVPVQEVQSAALVENSISSNVEAIEAAPELMEVSATIETIDAHNADDEFIPRPSGDSSVVEIESLHVMEDTGIPAANQDTFAHEFHPSVSMFDFDAVALSAEAPEEIPPSTQPQQQREEELFVPTIVSTPLLNVDEFVATSAPVEEETEFSSFTPTSAPLVSISEAEVAVAHIEAEEDFSHFNDDHVAAVEAVGVAQEDNYHFEEATATATVVAVEAGAPSAPTFTATTAPATLSLIPPPTNSSVSLSTPVVATSSTTPAASAPPVVNVNQYPPEQQPYAAATTYPAQQQTSAANTPAYLMPPAMEPMQQPVIQIAAHSVIVADAVPANNSAASGGNDLSRGAATNVDLTQHVSLRRRQIQPYRVEPQRNGKFRAFVSLKQPYLKKSEISPQGNRPEEIILGDCASESIARDLCECFSPPVWQSKVASAANPNTCTLCQVGFSMFSQPHHCRNCGFLMCGNCSDKIWPSTMLPETFHDENKNFVRICHSCHYLIEHFVVALCQGDYQMVRSLYATGNINLHQPYTVYTHHAYPVHYAVIGGNLDILRWLIDVKRCSIINQIQKTPLMTQTGWTLLGLAAYCGHVNMIQFLVHEKKCAVTEIKEVVTLQRAMHALLQIPTPMPEFVLNQKTNPLSQPHLQALQDDLLFMLRHHPVLRNQISSTTTSAHGNSADPHDITAAVAYADSYSQSNHPSASAASASATTGNLYNSMIPSATAQEAPVILAAANIEAAPAQINTLGIQTQTNIGILQGLSKAALTRPVPKSRYLCPQAVFWVEEFLEYQRRTMWYTPPAISSSSSTTVAMGMNPAYMTGNVMSMGGVSPAPAGDVVALASPVGASQLPASLNAANATAAAVTAAAAAMTSSSNGSASHRLIQNSGQNTPVVPAAGATSSGSSQQGSARSTRSNTSTTTAAMSTAVPGQHASSTHGHHRHNHANNNSHNSGTNHTSRTSTTAGSHSSSGNNRTATSRR